MRRGLIQAGLSILKRENNQVKINLTFILYLGRIASDID